MNQISGTDGYQHVSGLKNIFRSLRYRNYRLFFGGQSLSLVGTWIQRIAIPWLVYDLTGSVFMLGLVSFAAQIPAFVIAPFAGVLTDRWNRYHILIMTQILSMLQAFILAALFYTGVIAIWHIIVLSLMLGCLNAFDVPARQSFVIEMVERKEDLGNAIALNSSMFNSARLLGPSVAGILIASAGEGICFLINGVSYLFVIVSLLMMRVRSRTVPPRHQRVFKALQEGFRYTFGFGPIRPIILLIVLVSLMGMPYIVLMPVIATQFLHGGSHTFGFLMGSAGVGALTGAIYLASRKDAEGLEKIIPFSAALSGTGLIFFSLSRVVWLSMILMIVIGLGMITQIASSNTIIQTVVDDDKRGRVMSIYAMSLMGTMPIGSFLAGSLASVIGAPTTLLIGGILCIAGALVFALKHKKAD